MISKHINSRNNDYYDSAYLGSFRYKHSQMIMIEPVLNNYHIANTG